MTDQQISNLAAAMIVELSGAYGAEQLRAGGPPDLPAIERLATTTVASTMDTLCRAELVIGERELSLFLRTVLVGVVFALRECCAAASTMLAFDAKILEDTAALLTRLEAARAPAGGPETPAA